MTRLTLNMIVRNESERIERALASVAPYIDGYVIADTGSTDDTIERIEKFFDARGICGKIVKTKFKNFEQARNFALDEAAHVVRSGHFLLMDADMELVVEAGVDPFVDLDGASYDIVQKAGTISYHNRRLLRANHPGRYIGVTHEYLNAATAGTLKGCYFFDHADGSNRKDKYKRDAELLVASLNRNPGDARGWYYLGQSYRDAGNARGALTAFNKRIALKGWDEEVWQAMVNAAHCKLALKDEGGFVNGLLQAFEFRPRRAEPLYDLSKYFREKGQYHLAWMFADTGYYIPRPDDTLFVNDFVYNVGFHEELSIAGFYLDNRREYAAKLCDTLALSPNAPQHSRDLARFNNTFYLRPLVDHVPSFDPHRIWIALPLGWTALNPSIAMIDDRVVKLVRAVNYTLTPEGVYDIDGKGSAISDDNPIRTRNFISNDGEPWRELVYDLPEPKFKKVLGMEDVRLYRDGNGALAGVANLREQNEGGICEQYKFKINSWTAGLYSAHDFVPISSLAAHEKNWMPVEGDKRGRLFYRLDQVIENHPEADRVPTGLAVENISGGSQAIAYKAGYLAVVHESKIDPATGQRCYQHRFVWWDKDLVLQRVSRPFVFHERQIEFAAGLAYDTLGNTLFVSYGVKDCEAWIASMNGVDLDTMLWGVS
jgi:glycosyltransferase involved in cell wall biosynthesis